MDTNVEVEQLIYRNTLKGLLSDYNIDSKKPLRTYDMSGGSLMIAHSLLDIFNIPKIEFEKRIDEEYKKLIGK